MRRDLCAVIAALLVKVATTSHAIAEAPGAGSIQVASAVGGLNALRPAELSQLQRFHRSTDFSAPVGPSDAPSARSLGPRDPITAAPEPSFLVARQGTGCSVSPVWMGLRFRCALEF